VGTCAFEGCCYLENITLPNTIVSIGEGVFGQCESLTEITIPNSVISIHEDAFWGCGSLTTINVDKEEDSIGGSPWGAENATINWNTPLNGEEE
jgi:hypothetical protein